MMNSKLALICCALLLIIGSSNADNPDVEEPHYQPKYRNFDGTVIHDGDESHPNKICAKSVDGSYWVNVNNFETICSSKIVCRPPWPQDDVELDVIPVTGVACDTPGRHACIDQKCTYLILEDVAAQAELESSRKVYKDFDGEVILSNNAKHPFQLCAKALNDSDVSWSNERSEDTCSSNIQCYAPSKGLYVTLEQKPPTGVVLGPLGRKICENGASRSVEYYVPEQRTTAHTNRNAHRLGHRVRLFNGRYVYTS